MKPNRPNLTTLCYNQIGTEELAFLSFLSLNTKIHNFCELLSIENIQQKLWTKHLIYIKELSVEIYCSSGTKTNCYSFALLFLPKLKSVYNICIHLVNFLHNGSKIQVTKMKCWLSFAQGWKNPLSMLTLLTDKLINN